MRNLNIKHLRKSLDCLCQFLDDVYHINSGGCCLIAYLIASNLDKLGVKYSLVVYNDSRKCISGITREVTSMSKATSSVNSVTGGEYLLALRLKDLSRRLYQQRLR